MRRAIGLVRVSTEEQASLGRAGVDRQRYDIEQIARSEQLELTKTVELIGVSGSLILEDDRFLAILDELKNPQIAGVAVSAIDRIARPESHGALAVFDPFYRHSKLIFTPGKTIDVRKDDDFLLTGLLGLMAGIERRQILRRIRGGKEENRKKGRLANSKITLPRGVDFDFETGKWSWKEPEAGKIRNAYALLLAGESLKSIAKKLNLGTDRGLSITLRNPIYVGIREYAFERGDRRKGDNGKTTKDRQKVARQVPLRVKLNLAPLVEQDTWDHAQRILSDVRKTWSQVRSTPSRFELTGLLTCGVCGERYYSRSDRRPGKHDIYYCKSRHPKGKGCGSPVIWRECTDEAAAKLVRDYLANPEALRSLLAAADTCGDDDQSIPRLYQELTRIERERDRLLNLGVQGLFTVEQIRRKALQLDNKQSELLVKLERERRPTEDPNGSALLIASVFAEFEFLPVLDRKRLLRRFVSSISVKHREFVGVKLRLPMSASSASHTGKDSLPPPA